MSYFQAVFLQMKVIWRIFYLLVNASRSFIKSAQLGNKFVGQMDVSPFTIQSADTEKSLFWVAGFWINPVKQFTRVNNVTCKERPS